MLADALVTVSIVIPAYNAETTIARAVACAKAQEGLTCAPEVIVVDDGSADRTGEIVRSLDGVRYVRQDNAGPAAARNHGWRVSSGAVVMLTDSDCEAAPDWAAKLLAAFEEGDVGAAGGSYTMANGGFLAGGIHWEIVARHRRFGRYVRALGSYNLAVRRAVMDEVGGFDESYPTASGEDNDLSYKISAAGRKLRWVGDATVGHHHTTSLPKYLKEQYRHGFFRTKLYCRHVRRILGDDYTLAKDILEPPLVLALIAALAVCWIGPLWIAPLIVLGLLAAIQIPMTVRMVRCSGRLSAATHAGVMFLRAFARTAGFVAGILRGSPGRRREPAKADG